MNDDNQNPAENYDEPPPQQTDSGGEQQSPGGGQNAFKDLQKFRKPSTGNRGTSAVQNSAENLAKQKTKDVIKDQGKKRLAQFAAKQGAGIAAKSGLAAAAPYIGIALLIIFLFFLLIVIIMMMFGYSQEDMQTQVGLYKIGPELADNGTDIYYTLEMTYEGTAEDIIIYDPIPSNATYVSSDPVARLLDANGNETTGTVAKVAWSLKEIQGTTGTFAPQTMTLTLRPSSPDIYVVNVATANVIGGQIGLDPVSLETCDGYYTLNNPLGNFGDPQCALVDAKNLIYTRLQAIDPANASYWFNVVIPCESSYNPNAYAPPSTGTPDSNGAWGLLQMGSDPDGDGSGKNGPYDRGDVPWETQLYNAVQYNRILINNGTPWAYWWCAKDKW
jgi:hypothetical protein